MFTSVVSEQTGMQPALSRKSCRSDRRNAPEQAAEVALSSPCSLAAEWDGTEQSEGPSGGGRGWFLML